MSYDERIRMAAIVETLEFAILAINCSEKADEHLIALETAYTILKELSTMAHPKSRAA